MCGSWSCRRNLAERGRCVENPSLGMQDQIAEEEGECITLSSSMRTAMG